MAAGNDQDLYERHAQAWWDPSDRTFRSLASVKEFHLRLLLEHRQDPLAGAIVVDLGCGGGLFALPLAEQGAHVLGVDLSGSSVRVARREAADRSVVAEFVNADLRRAPVADGCADVVLLSDVIEHVSDPEGALAEAARILRPGGLLFANTFDRTWVAARVVVDLAEGVGLVPRGTHDPRLFVRPAELRAMAARSGLKLERIQWEALAFARTLRTWTVCLRRARRGFGYTAFFVKDTH